MLRQAIGSCLAAFMAASASAQTPAGGEFLVNAYTTSDQFRARSAMAPNGDFVVAWTSSDQDGDGLGVFGQRLSAAGAPRGSEFQINAYTTGWQRDPAVAVGSRGDFIVTWVNDEANPGLGVRIQGRRYDAAGTAIGGEFAVSVSTTINQTAPRIGRASDGRFVVLWESRTDGSGRAVAARRFDASGNPLGGEFVVNTYTTGYQVAGDLAVEADGKFVAVWQDANARDGSADAIFGQRFDASGNQLGSEFQVNTYTTGRQRDPSVSVSPAGGFVVAWTSLSGDGDVYGMFSRRFDSAGNGVGNDFVVNTYTTGYQYGSIGQVAHDVAGNFIVTWNGRGAGDSRGSFAQRFSASGARRGGEFQANTYTTAAQSEASVTSDAVGNFAVIWQSDTQDGSSFGIFAQRFGGLGPAALTVDTTGNQVLEPGETVDARPSWRNSIGAAQAFSGTLSNITGPSGATYAITDGVGDYGTLADGATGACIDCYGVSVSNPPTRPVVHWDASALESISPDVQGQQQQWLLHVGRSFTDVPPTSGFYRFIETLLHHAVTGGCTSTQYCPATTTTRDQMAVFVLVAKEGAGYVPPACATPVFSDVPASNPFCRWIEELSRRGVVGGCGGGNYCPSNPVTREQMAVFVLRTLDPALAPPACTTPVFADVPASSPFCRWIEELARRAVVGGCGGGNYCPTGAVTREQMGVFISVTFGLTLYGP